MKSLKIVTILLIFSGILALPSCYVDSCSGVDFDSFRYFDTQDLEVYAFLGENWWDRIPETDTLSSDDLGGIYIDFITEYVAQRRSKWELSNPFMSHSYACSIIPGYEGAKDEQLKRLDIISLDFWDLNHQAGSSLNDILQYKGNYLRDFDYSLEQFIKAQTGLLQSEDVRLSFNQLPLKVGSYPLKVILEFTSGEKYEEDFMLNIK